jgi:hypothetical protein
VHIIALVPAVTEPPKIKQAAGCQILQQESKSQAICRWGFGLESFTADWNQIQ